MKPTLLETAKLRLANRLIGRIGSRARRSTRMKATVEITPVAANASTSGECQGNTVPPSPVNRMMVLSASVSRIAPA